MARHHMLRDRWRDLCRAARWDAQLERDVRLHPSQRARDRQTHVADVIAVSPNLQRMALDVRCLSSSGTSPQVQLERAEA
eukprot:4161695-Amphidinium_carterae.1